MAIEDPWVTMQRQLQAISSSPVQFPGVLGGLGGGLGQRPVEHVWVPDKRQEEMRIMRRARRWRRVVRIMRRLLWNE